MRALAEFVMKDRRSAIIAVLLLGLVPMLNLLSPVIVGLTMLRKGWNDALAILVWDANCARADVAAMIPISVAVSLCMRAAPLSIKTWILAVR